MMGASLSENLNSSSQNSAWQRFYNKNIVKEGVIFQKSVYKKSGKYWRFEIKTVWLGSTQLGKLVSERFSFDHKDFTN